MIKMKGLRKKINDFVREKGNKYSFGLRLGDLATADAVETGKKAYEMTRKGLGKTWDYVSSIPREAYLAGLIGLSALTIGCSTTPAKEEYSLEKSKKQIMKDLQESNRKDNERYVQTVKGITGDTQTLVNKLGLDLQKRKIDRYFEAAEEENERTGALFRFPEIKIPKIGLDMPQYNFDDPKPGKHDSEMFLHLSPFFQMRTPTKANDIDVKNLDPYTITGFELGWGRDDIFGYFRIGSNFKTKLENSDLGASYSSLDSTVTSYELGGMWNFIDTDKFDFGLHAYILQNNENIDGYSLDTNGNRRDFDYSGETIGYGLGLQIGFKPCEWFELVYGKGKNWYGDSDSVREEWADTVMAKFKIKL